jgi:hypothetical protein
MSTKTIIRKQVDNITKESKYDIIDDYIYSGVTIQTLADKYKTTTNNIELIITRHYKALSNVRETRVLLSQQPTLYQSFKMDVLDPEKINKEFLSLLSEPDSLILTDNEVIFCELMNYDGDDIKAIVESKLDAGLKRTKDHKDREQYKQAMHLRAFYLKRKPNVAAYLQKIQQDKLKTIVDGKGFIQSQLLSIMEKVRNLEGERAAMTQLKCVEQLARTVGAFEDNLNITGLDGDSAIDKILRRAKEAKGTLIEQEDSM